ncbi:hypothetical protein GCM10010149_53670 [Nonomuraea roseoviolacea subsp. roseoviolacea]|uniref:Uncharacterized protein n=3 Tax=Nonomuraea TaxID=83681 RepID=A0A7Y6M6J4_9ACTN|nr:MULTISPECIES: hypothetical protein [Nonomuraea]MCP2347316.1 uncharacterized protein (UPF0210 family) [Nonomuraea roseoviolacea subsp. carminata]NUW36978.1 hypothetical protein [Nonomuraea montanisoli]NUW44490.1 hypothetical protein [Nonomuraea rhodomycinica]
MRTVIVRLVEPEQSGGQLRGLLEEVGGEPVPFHGTEAALDLLYAAAGLRRDPP